MATFTLTGTFAHQDAAQTPIVNTKISIAADPYPLSTKLLALGKVVETDANGQINVSMTTGTAGLYYVVRSLAKHPVFLPIRFLAPASGTIDISSLVFYNPSGTPPLQQDLVAIRDAALAAVASVAVSTWQANTAVVANQVVKAPSPDGSEISSNSSRTTRATFDATEQANWTPVLSKLGTLAQKSLAGVPISVTDVAYGAVADFGTGNTNNATAINAAITVANARGGGVVTVPSGVFGISAPIVMKSNVVLQVVGTIKALAAHTGAGITVTDVSNVTITGPGTIDMNKAATTNGGSITTQQGILVSTATASTLTGIRISDITVTNCWHYGVVTSAQVASSSISDVVIDHVTVSNAGQDAIACLGIGSTSTPTSPPPGTSHGYAVTRCTITNPSVNGILCAGISDVSIDKNVLTATASTGHGICMAQGGAGQTTDHVTDFTVTGNKIRGFSGAGCWGIVVSARCARWDVSGNKIRACQGGITTDVMDPNATTAIILVDGTIANNSCVGSTVGHGINCQALTGLTITGNVCRGNAGSGISLSLSVGVVITGNDCLNNTGAGIALFGTGAGLGGHTVKGNNVSGNTGGDYYNECPVVSTFDTQSNAALTTQQVLASSAVETTQFSYVIPARREQAGTTYRVTAGFIVDNIATSGTLTIRLKGHGGGQVLASVVIPSQAGAASTQAIFVDFLVTVRNISSTVGKVFAMGHVRSQMGALDAAISNLVQNADTTAGATLSLTSQWATANAGNICRLELAAVDVVKS